MNVFPSRMCFFLSLFAPLPAMAGDVGFSQERELQRYENIWRVSPFVTEPVPNLPSEPLQERYAMTGYANVGGNDVVFLLDRESLARFSISSNRPEEGVRLVSVSDNGGGTIVARIRVGNRDANVALDVGAQQAMVAVSMTNTLPGPISEYEGTRDK